MPTSAPVTISRSLRQHEAGRCRGPAGVAVQHRDDHRHVRAADRHHDVHAEQARDGRHRQAAASARLAGCRLDEARCRATRLRDEQRRGSASGAPAASAACRRSMPCSLPNAMIEPVNVTAPMRTPRKISTSWMVFSAPVRTDGRVDVGREARRALPRGRRSCAGSPRAAASASSRRARATTSADQRADRRTPERGSRKPPTCDAEHGGDEREHHADDAVDVAAPRRLLLAQAAEARMKRIAAAM